MDDKKRHLLVAVPAFLGLAAVAHHLDPAPRTPPPLPRAFVSKQVPRGFAADAKRLAARDGGWDPGPGLDRMLLSVPSELEGAPPPSRAGGAADGTQPPARSTATDEQAPPPLPLTAFPQMRPQMTPPPEDLTPPPQPPQGFAPPQPVRHLAPVFHNDDGGGPPMATMTAEEPPTMRGGGEGGEEVEHQRGFKQIKMRGFGRRRAR